jgi:hypothetical protein
MKKYLVTWSILDVNGSKLFDSYTDAKNYVVGLVTDTPEVDFPISIYTVTVDKIEKF